MRKLTEQRIDQMLDAIDTAMSLLEDTDDRDTHTAERLLNEVREDLEWSIARTPNVRAGRDYLEIELEDAYAYLDAVINLVAA